MCGRSLAFQAAKVNRAVIHLRSLEFGTHPLKDMPRLDKRWGGAGEVTYLYKWAPCARGRWLGTPHRVAPPWGPQQLCVVAGSWDTLGSRPSCACLRSAGGPGCSPSPAGTWPHGPRRAADQRPHLLRHRALQPADVFHGARHADRRRLAAPLRLGLRLADEASCACDEPSLGFH